MQDPANDWGKKDQSTSQVFLDLFLGDDSFCLLGIAKFEFSTLLQTNPDDTTCQKTYLDVKINKHLAIQDQIQRSSFCSVKEKKWPVTALCFVSGIILALPLTVMYKIVPVQQSFPLTTYFPI